MNRKFILIFALLLVVLAVPTSVHAAGLLPTAANIAASYAEGMLDFLLSIVGVVEDVLNKLLRFLGDGLQGFLDLPVPDGGYAVYAVWKTVRDICNMFFLLLMIAVAFGTVFNTLKPNMFHWRGALLNVLIAAIAINFSLAVGQTIITFGNIASKRVIALFGDQSVGNRVGKSLGYTVAKESGAVITQPGLLPPKRTLARGQFTPDQLAALNAWGEAGIQNAGTTLTKCLSSGTAKSGERLTVGECYDVAKKVADQELRALGDYSDEEKYKRIAWVSDTARLVGGLFVDVSRLYVGDISVFQDSTTGSQLATVNAERAAAGHAQYGAATNDAKGVATKTALLTSKLFKLFMLVVLNLAMLFVAVFMVIRLPISWFLLAVSAGAFFAIAVPNSNVFRQWLHNMVGWSVFGPMYLLNIYFGLFLLEMQSGMLLSLTGVDGNIPFAANLGPFLFFIITCAVFSVGAVMSMKFSFGLITVGAGAIKGVSSYLGVDEAGGYGVKTAARLTGIATRYEGAKAGLGSVYQRNISQPLARRDEDVKARYQARFGDPRALERLNRQRVDEGIKNKSYRSIDDVTGALAKLTPQGRQYLLRELERNQPILAARYAAQTTAGGSGPRGQVMDQVLSRNATRMSIDDWSEYLGEVVSRGSPMSPEMARILESKVRRPDQLAQMRGSTNNPAVLALIQNAVGNTQQRAPRQQRQANAPNPAQPPQTPPTVPTAPQTPPTPPTQPQPPQQPTPPPAPPRTPPTAPTPPTPPRQRRTPRPPRPPTPTQPSGPNTGGSTT